MASILTPPIEKPQFNPAATVEQRMTGLLSKNNPYLQQAETLPKQEANARGVLLSSMAKEAVESARIRAALPIAQQDAAALQNQDQAILQGEIQSGLYGVQAGHASDLSAQTAGQASDLSAQTAGQESKLSAQKYTETRAINEAARVADVAKTTAENNLKIALANMEIGNREKTAVSDSISSLGSVFAENVSNIQRDPNVTAANKTAAIASLENVYRANLGTMAAFYGVDVDFGAGIRGGGLIAGTSTSGVTPAATIFPTAAPSPSPSTNSWLTDSSTYPTEPAPIGKQWRWSYSSGGWYLEDEPSVGTSSY